MCGGNAQSINVCVYHYRRAVEGDNGGAGEYTLSVSGAGNAETWTSSLFCL